MKQQLARQPEFPEGPLRGVGKSQMKSHLKPQDSLSTPSGSRKLAREAPVCVAVATEQRGKTQLEALAQRQCGAEEVTTHFVTR